MDCEYPKPLTPKSVRFDVEDRNVDEEEEEDDSDDVQFIKGSPPPPTPSPTRSASTVSSGGIATPPSPYALLTETKGSPSPQPSGFPKLHPALYKGAPALEWDMAEDPSAIPALATDKDDPAASIHSRYPLSHMVLTNELLPEWPLHVAAPQGGRYLTVMQVLTLLRQHLLKRVSGEHYHTQTSDRKKEISTAYKERRKLHPDSDEGMIRLDYLPARTFGGLCVIGPQESDMQWEVRFDVV